MTKQQAAYRRVAPDNANQDVTVTDTAIVDEREDGAWVEVWVWVGKDQMEKECQKKETQQFTWVVSAPLGSGPPSP